MLELFSNFSIQQIILYTIVFCLAVKGIVEFYDWIKQKYEEKFNEDYNNKSQQQMLEEYRQKCTEQHEESMIKYNSLEDKIDNLTDTINQEFGKIDERLILLSHSSLNDIKAWIVETHHKYTKEGFIDDFTKDVVEKRFEDYKKLGGNSYIESLVEEIRRLPLR